MVTNTPQSNSTHNSPHGGRTKDESARAWNQKSPRASEKKQQIIFLSPSHTYTLSLSHVASHAKSLNFYVIKFCDGVLGQRSEKNVCRVFFLFHSWFHARTQSNDTDICCSQALSSIFSDNSKFFSFGGAHCAAIGSSLTFYTSHQYVCEVHS